MLLLKMKCQQLDMFPQEPGKEGIVGLDLADGWLSPLAAEKTEGVPIRRRGGGHRARELLFIRRAIRIGFSIRNGFG